MYKPILAMLMLAGFASAQLAPVQPYWTTQRKLDTVGVTLLHMADAAQTCYHLENPEVSTWQYNTTTTITTTTVKAERGFGTPRNCPGAAAYLIGSGPVLQYASYRITRRYPHSRFWAVVDRTLPHVEMSLSVWGISCSSSAHGCNKYGF